MYIHFDWTSIPPFIYVIISTAVLYRSSVAIQFLKLPTCGPRHSAYCFSRSLTACLIRSKFKAHCDFTHRLTRHTFAAMSVDWAGYYYGWEKLSEDDRAKVSKLFSVSPSLAINVWRMILVGLHGYWSHNIYLSSHVRLGCGIFRWKHILWYLMGFRVD